jgi:hypothetical protein
MKADGKNGSRADAWVPVGGDRHGKQAIEPGAADQA